MADEDGLVREPKQTILSKNWKVRRLQYDTQTSRHNCSKSTELSCKHVPGSTFQGIRLFCEKKGTLRNAPPQQWLSIGWSGALPTLSLHIALRIV